MTGWMTGNRNSSARRSFPFGPWGVGLLTAGLGALAGLLIPMAWIEEVSWQLYLDQLIAAARPPLGVTARLVAVLLLALGLGLVGWLIAKMLGVHASAGNVADWFARLRGGQVDDEPDAPALRSADRHPDAPARRPFSAARDVPVETELQDGSGWAAQGDDSDELLLDAHFDEHIVAVSADDDSRAERWDALDQVDVADEAAPELVADIVEPAAIGTAPVVDAEPASAPAPLDLSIARLDELIARLEAGLSRREAGVLSVAASEATIDVPSMSAAADSEPSIARGVDESAAEPSFPQDPALAAALATLRRMNRAS